MTYKDYWKIEATIGSNTLDTMFQFGLMPEGQAQRIVQYNNANNINEIKQAGAYSQTYSKGNFVNDRMSASFFLVNGLPLYWMVGKSVTTTYVHALTNFTEGRKPRISVFTEGDYRKYQALGNCMMGLDLEWEIGMPGILATCSWKGMTHGTSTATPTATYPSSIQTPFNQFDKFLWNTVEYKIVGFRCQTSQSLSALIGDSGYYQEISEFSPIVRVWSIVFKDGEDVTDIITDQQAGTGRAIWCGMKKADNVNDYLTLYNTPAYCIDIRETRIQDQPTRYEAVFVASVIADDVKDSVANSFYGEA
jgi:hypothetical protein